MKNILKNMLKKYNYPAILVGLVRTPNTVIALSGVFSTRNLPKKHTFH